MQPLAKSTFYILDPNGLKFLTRLKLRLGHFNSFCLYLLLYFMIMMMAMMVMRIRMVIVVAAILVSTITVADIIFIFIILLLSLFCMLFIILFFIYCLIVLLYFNRVKITICLQLFLYCILIIFSGFFSNCKVCDPVHHFVEKKFSFGIRVLGAFSRFHVFY